MDKIAAEAAKEIAETTFFAGTNPRWQQEQLEKKIYAALSQSLAARDKEIAAQEIAAALYAYSHRNWDWKAIVTGISDGCHMEFSKDAFLKGKAI